MKNKKNTGRIYLMLYLFFVVLFGISAWQVITYIINGQRLENNSRAISAKVDSSLSIVTQESDQRHDYKELFDDLRTVNPDTVAYIRIENTRIDYPVAQAYDNDYYIITDFSGNKSKHGAIFMDYRNTPDFSDQNTILYGHNMRDGTMFKDLLKYSSAKNKDELSPYIMIITEEEAVEWEIFSAYEVSIYDYLENLPFLAVDYINKDEKLLFIENAKKNSFFDWDTLPDEFDKILTLVTCTNSRTNYRHIVHAKNQKRHFH